VKEAGQLLAELSKHEANADGGQRVRANTVERVLDKGRDLRERLRTLKTLLGLEVTQVEEQLGQLQSNVQTFLDRIAADEARRAADAAAKKKRK
jgi:hypothetical protein